VLSRLPVVERLEPADVTRILDSVADAMAPTPLRMKDYRDAAARCAAAGARYGALFDALHLVAAERAGVDALLTWNDGDFRRFSPRIPILAPPPRLGLPG
jgi:predicted nucleic acid-binding protein